MLYLNRKFRCALLYTFILFVAACGGGGSGGGSGGDSSGSSGGGQLPVGVADTGEVTVLATDADTDLFSEINLSIVRAELLGEGGRELLFEGEKTFNLLALANVTEVLSVSEVPAGTYNKIRLTLTRIELIFHDGRSPEYPKLPGNGKLDINPRGVFYVDSDNPLTIQLDFDAEKSIKIVGRGNGKFNFRPVVFTKEVENRFDTKLIRQTGVVRNLNEDAGSFDLCLVEADEGNEEDCIRVASNGDTSIFDRDGEAIGPGSLENGALVTVVGHLIMGKLSPAALAGIAPAAAAEAAVGIPLRQLETGVSLLVEDPQCEEIEGELICEGNLVCEMVEGELVCEEIEEPEAPVCEEIEGLLICDGMECEEVEGDLICEGNLICDDIEDELVCEEIEEPSEPLCEEVEGQLICDGMVCEEREAELICDGNLVCDDIEDELVCEEIEEPSEPLCEEIEGQLICDGMVCEEREGELICDGTLICDDVEDELVCEEIKEEEHCFEFEGELICDEDCEEVEGELICDDDKPGTVILLADVIWIGDTVTRTENIACGSVREDDVLGTWYPNAQLGGGVAPECDGDNSAPTILLPGARIYDDDGRPLGTEAIKFGVINVVDGIPSDAGLKALLVILEKAREEALRQQLSGTIGVLESESFSLMTDLGDRCVTFDESDTDVFVTGLDDEGNTRFNESTVVSLEVGQRTDAFGEQNVEGCLEAETLIVESE